jgi:autotransporter-associated beta strand protein
MNTVRVQCSGFRVQVIALLATAVMLLPCISHATTRTWTGTGGNNRWTNNSNWSPSGQPASGDSVLFDGNGINLNTDVYNVARTLNGISFASAQTNAVTINTTTNYPITFNPGKVLSVAAGNHKFIGTGYGVSGQYDMAFTGSAGNAYTNDISSGASFEIQGRMVNTGGSTSSRSFVKMGEGTLILSGDSGGGGSWNFSGGSGFKIQEGVLRLAVSGAGGNSGNSFIVSSGASLEVSGSSTHGAGAGIWTLNGTGVSSNGALRSISGTNTLTSSGVGTIALASASSIGVDSGSKLTISRVISGANSMTKVGAGTLILSTTNTYSGTTVVEAGTLGFGINSALSASSSISLSGGTLAVGTYSNALSNATLTQDSSIDLGDGTGTLSFAGGTGTWSGTLSLSGTLGEKTLRFGTDANGLTAEQQSKIKLNGYSTKLNSQGYVVLLRGTVLMIF